MLVGNPLPKDFFAVWNGLGHGGEGETSICLELFPELCDFSKAAGVVPQLPKNLEAKWLFKELANTGATGDPTKGSAEKGRKMRQVLVGAMVKALSDLDKAGWDWRSPEVRKGYAGPPGRDRPGYAGAGPSPLYRPACRVISFHAMSITPCRPPWKGRLSARERLNNQMHYRGVDRCFNMEFGYWDENFTLWDIFRENGIRTNEEADLFFSFDRFHHISPRYWMHPDFEGREVSRTATTRTIINKDGLFAESPLDGHDTIPHFVKASIVTPEDWKRAKAERFRLDDPARTVDVEAIRRAHPPDRDYPLGVDCGSMIGRVRDVLTLEGLAYAVYDYPEMVEDMVETCCRLVEGFLDQVLGRIDFDFASGWEDIAFKNGPIVSVGFFRDVIVPRYQRISRKLHAAGIDLWYTDCDGDVRPLLPLFLEGGINCLFPFEVNSCTHPRELLDQYGKELRIMGGVDKIELGKGPEAIRKYLDTLVPIVERGGYIPFCDHRCPPNVKPADYLYYLDLKERMFGLGSALYPEP